jgi:hypothetical protein
VAELAAKVAALEARSSEEIAILRLDGTEMEIRMTELRREHLAEIVRRDALITHLRLRLGEDPVAEILAEADAAKAAKRA